MASLIPCAKLATLLSDAAASGLPWAWIEDDRLWLGAEPLFKRAEVSLSDEAVRFLTLQGTAGEKKTIEAASRAVHATAPVGPPQPAGETPPLPALVADRSGRRTGNHFADFGRQRVGAASAKSLLIACLEYVERQCPGTLEALSREKGRTKRIVARRREDLYANPSVDLRSERIAGGWWVATTNSTPEVEKFIRRAGFLAGLTVTAVGRL